MSQEWQLGPHSIISSGWEIWRGKQKIAEVGDLRHARMIGAAPDMLAALKSACDQADKALHEKYSGARSPDCQRIYDQCKAAIAKAEWT